MPPIAEDVAAYLGRPGDTTVVGLAEHHLPIVEAMVRRYVRGNGFDAAGFPDGDLSAVIVSCTARAVSNPAHTVTEAIDDFNIRHGVFNGWTLPELAILHSYRRRTA
ncbi:hypothetical protein [Geodermatophilus sp. SYSU D01176]